MSLDRFGKLCLNGALETAQQCLDQAAEFAAKLGLATEDVLGNSGIPALQAELEVLLPLFKIKQPLERAELAKLFD